MDEKWNEGKCLVLISRGIIKHLHHVNCYNTTWYHLLFTECQKEDLELVYKTSFLGLQHKLCYLLGTMI